MDGTGPGSCSLLVFAINSNEPMGSASRVVVTITKEVEWSFMICHSPENS